MDLRFAQQQASTATRAAKRRRPLISLTPLVDVVFLLLVFFMLASNFSQQSTLELDIGVQQSGQTDAEPRAVLLRVHQDGIDLSGEPVSLEVLRARVESWSRTSSERSAIIYLVQPDPGVVVQTVVTVLDMLEEAGAQNVTLVSGRGI